MNTRIFPGEHEAADALADVIVRALGETAQPVLGLPAGRTPIPVYRELGARASRGTADFSRATTFNLDEFVGVAPDHPGSYHSYMQEYLFRHVSLAPYRIHFLDGSAADADAECARYERAIVSAGGIGLLILGLGTNGHIGFNEPDEVLVARTHRAQLRPETRQANAALFGGNVEQVPREGLSMGMATILQARSIALLATGRSKADAVQRMICGPLTTRVPASFLQVHGDITVILDAAAAERVR